MNEQEVEDLEVELVIDAIYRCYGHDFRNYSKASLTRRIRTGQIKLGCNTISEMIPRILHDESFFRSLLENLSINVTEMFRDPRSYLALKEKVVPLLRTYPFIKIWCAGCSTGEEVYSLAILLEEEGLYERCTIYATDFNDAVLQKAKEGIYSVENVKEHTANYQKTNPSSSLSQYYHSRYDSIIMDKKLKRNITFANHNLVTDGRFTEVHLILCRNVLIYFNRSLQNRVLELFTDSLVSGGFLCLGSKENLRFTKEFEHYLLVDREAKIYRKVRGA